MTALSANEIPLLPHEFCVRFALVLGLPMSLIFRDNVYRSNNAAQRFQQSADRIKLKVTEVSDVFHQYFEKKSTLELCLLKLDKLMRNPGSRASKKRRRRSFEAAPYQSTIPCHVEREYTPNHPVSKIRLHHADQAMR